MYDERDIRLRVSKRRQRFIIYLFIAVFIFASGIVLLALDLSDTFFFLGIIISLASLVYITKLFASFSPRTIFSSAIKGKNVKEDAYIIHVRSGAGGVGSVGIRSSQVGSHSPTTVQNHTRTARSRVKASVYLMLDDGNVKEIRGLGKEHIELYADGDMLYKPCGTKYPVILNRYTERQPCPICGAINLTKDEECISCGLKILNA